MTMSAMARPRPSLSPGRANLIERFRTVRAQTEKLVAHLHPEDCVVSSMPDVSPAKWHLAHTTWFFETFVLTPHIAGYEPYDARFAFLFNSYYVQAGERHCRAQRGLVTRPTVSEVFAYRAYVDDAVARLEQPLRDGQLPPRCSTCWSLGFITSSSIRS